MANEKIKDVEGFKAYVSEVEAQNGYRKPVGFGICRVDRGQKNRDKILQAVYPLINWNENFGSAAVLIGALQECGETIDFGASEQVFDVTDEFIVLALNAFAPFVCEAEGEKHKNVQVMTTLAGIAAAEILEDLY